MPLEPDQLFGCPCLMVAECMEMLSRKDRLLILAEQVKGPKNFSQGLSYSFCPHSSLETLKRKWAIIRVFSSLKYVPKFGGLPGTSSFCVSKTQLLSSSRATGPLQKPVENTHFLFVLQFFSVAEPAVFVHTTEDSEEYLNSHLGLSEESDFTGSGVLLAETWKGFGDPFDDCSIQSLDSSEK
nr:hypothetical protein Iba_chr13cCG10760 [Ipomoea batatas]